MDASHLTSIGMNAARSRRKRAQRERRQALVETKIQISSQPILRTLKPSVRRRLKKERAPSLWILPDDINFSERDESTYPRASLLGLPAELRQNILILSYSVDVKAAQELASDRLWEKLRKSRRRTNIIESSEPQSKRPLTVRERIAMGTLGARVTELCQVSKIMRKDMQYVGGRWHREIEVLLHRKVEVDILSLPTFDVPRSSVYIGSRQRSIVVAGDDRPAKGRRPGKCWYCTERHMPGLSGCPRAMEDTKRWLKETRKVGGWRSRAEERNPFKATKLVFDD